MASGTTTTFVLCPPESLRCGGGSPYRCGGATYRLLAHLAAAGGTTTTARLAKAVWGREAGPQVSRNTLKRAVGRASDALVGIGAAERVALNGDAVLLV